MKKKLINIAVFVGYLLALLLLGIAATKGHKISIYEQKPILDSLVTISSIVFGLMGVWLSVIYSDSLKTIFDSELDSVEKTESIKNFRYLSKPMIVAAIIIGYVLLFNFLYPVLHEILWLDQYYLIIRRVSFIVLSLLIIAQIWTIIYIFAPAENIRNKAEHQIETQGRNERITKNTKAFDDSEST